MHVKSIFIAALALAMLAPLLALGSHDASAGGRYAPLADQAGLLDVDFVDASSGYAVGDAGVILKTTTGGEQWTLLNSGVSVHLNAVDFVSANVAYAVGGMGTVLKTANGGSTWTVVTLNAAYDLIEVQFPQSDRVGYAAGLGFGVPPVFGQPMPNIVFKTEDGGATWRELPVPEGLIEDMHFVNDQLGFIAHERKLVKTSDGGLSWHTIALPDLVGPGAGTNPYSTEFLSEQVGYVTTTGGKVLKTEDGGLSWVVQQTEYPDRLHSVDFVSPQVGYALAGDFFLVATVDGGATWRVISPSLKIGGLLALKAVDASTVYAVGLFGTIIKSADGGATWVSQYVPPLPEVSPPPIPPEDLPKLLKSEPSADATLAEPPASVELWFDKEPGFGPKETLVRVYRDGEIAHSGVATADPDDPGHLTLALRPDLGPGSYEVIWSVTAAQEPKIANSGTFQFVVGETSEASASPSATLDASQPTPSRRVQNLSPASQTTRRAPAAPPRTGVVLSDSDRNTYDWASAALLAVGVSALGGIVWLSGRGDRRD